jgi:hypothetical protein
MRETRITFPELALIAGTRAAAGAGLALLLADRLSAEQRKGAGWALLLVGALGTIPLAFEILGGQRLVAADESVARAEDESVAKAKMSRMGKRPLPAVASPQRNAFAQN